MTWYLTDLWSRLSWLDSTVVIVNLLVAILGLLVGTYATALMSLAVAALYAVAMSSQKLVKEQGDQIDALVRARRNGGEA
ncbi:hypothetical protein GTA09_20765 [Rhodococcus hoagii]|nr:hypothetical protein [Prescottella equi]